ncbi:hypothetical protein [Streptomyces sp. NPDC054829]
MTGDTWAPTGPAATAYRVPLPLGVWRWLVDPEPHPPLTASVRVPRDDLHDGRPPEVPNRSLRADRGVFEHTLARLPEARAAWLRTILTDVGHREYPDLFC